LAAGLNARAGPVLLAAGINGFGLLDGKGLFAISPVGSLVYVPGVGLGLILAPVVAVVVVIVGVGFPPVWGGFVNPGPLIFVNDRGLGGDGPNHGRGRGHRVVIVFDVNSPVVIVFPIIGVIHTRLGGEHKLVNATGGQKRYR
jgi:hypothetical protein